MTESLSVRERECVLKRDCKIECVVKRRVWGEIKDVCTITGNELAFFLNVENQFSQTSFQLKQ